MGSLSYGDNNKYHCGDLILLSTVIRIDSQPLTAMHPYRLLLLVLQCVDFRSLLYDQSLLQRGTQPLVRLNENHQ